MPPLCLPAAGPPSRLMAALLLALIACPAGASADERLAQAVERARRATVGILDNTPAARQSGYEARFSLRGTGVHLGDGYLVTARHAVERPEGSELVLPQRIMILTQDLDELPATLTGGNAYLDLAIYRLDTSGTTPVAAASFAEKDSTAGQEVFTVGYPLGWGPVIAFGRMGNPNTFLPTVDTRLLQANVASCSGNSGGGLFTADGELAGIMHAVIKTEATPGEQGCSQLAFAIPGMLAKKIAVALIKGEKPAFSRLGIQLTAVKIGTRWRTAVGKVFEPALSGGVQKGDLLLAIDGMNIRDAAHLKNYLIERTVPGQNVALRVRRGDQALQLTVTLAKSE